MQDSHWDLNRDQVSVCQGCNDRYFGIKWDIVPYDLQGLFPLGDFLSTQQGSAEYTPHANYGLCSSSVGTQLCSSGYGLSLTALGRQQQRREWWP